MAMSAGTRERIVAAVSAGATFLATAQEFGVSRSAVAGVIGRLRRASIEEGAVKPLLPAFKPHPVKAWSEGDKAIVRQMWTEGENDPAIAKRLGRSSMSIASLRRTIGCMRPPTQTSRGEAWSAENDARMRELNGRGLTDAEIGLIMGRTAESVSKRRKRLGIAGHVPRWGDKAFREQRVRASRIVGEHFARKAETIPMPPHVDVWEAFETLRGCRFISGDPKADAMSFCNEPRNGASSYCAAHHGVVYGGPTFDEPAPARPMTRMQLRAHAYPEAAE